MNTDPHAGAVPLINLWRGGRLESQHRGHVVISDMQGIVASWGDPEAIVYPRSSVKMIQALPLLTSGAGRDLSDKRLAFACASHQGAAIHAQEAAAWLDALGLQESDLRCGPQVPGDKDEKFRLIRAEETPCQLHNNCSGKHCGFLMLGQHLGGGPDYIAADHPVQIAVRDAFETVTDRESPGYGIDGCSAPNFASSMAAIARAMAWFASARNRSDSMSVAAARLVRAMFTHPEMVAGEGRACTRLMRVMDGVAIKTGAEGVFIAILPERGLGVAIKIADGATRAAEAALVHVLAALGALDPAHPEARAYLGGPILNRRNIVTGECLAAEGFAP